MGGSRISPPPPSEFNFYRLWNHSEEPHVVLTAETERLTVRRRNGVPWASDGIGRLDGVTGRFGIPGQPYCVGSSIGDGEPWSDIDQAHQVHPEPCRINAGWQVVHYEINHVISFDKSGS